MLSASPEIWGSKYGWPGADLIALPQRVGVDGGVALKRHGRR